MSRPGCGCDACRKPLPDTPFPGAARAKALHADYAAAREVWRAENPHVTRDQLAEKEISRV